MVRGIASALLGIGGGIVAVPLMISLFAVSDLIAKGTSLLVSVPTSGMGTRANRRAGLVEVRVGLAVGIAAAEASVPSVGLARSVGAHFAPLSAGLLVSVKAGREQASR